jgi:hypothetical protein
MWENKKRDRTGTLEAFDNAYEDDLTDRKVKSRRGASSSTTFILTVERRTHNFVTFYRGE